MKLNNINEVENDFNSAVFKEKVKELSSPGVVVVPQKKNNTLI